MLLNPLMVHILHLGQFHKTLWIRKLRICSYGQILTVNVLINCKKFSNLWQNDCKLQRKKFYGIGP